MIRSAIGIGLSLCLALALATPTPAAAADRSDAPRSLIIIVDGLRPDYVTAELTPRLHALAEDGAYGETHSAAFPTVTRVNSPTVATGSYPATHGLLHNNMYHPAMGEESFSTGSADNLLRFDEAVGGDLLTTPSLGEVLAESDLRLLAVGSGGTGNTLLQNHRGTGVGIWQAQGLFLPEAARRQAAETVGEPPGDRGPDGTRWAVDAYLHHALGDTPPDVTILWIGEADAAGHQHGVGAPDTLQAVAHIDEHIGRALDAHEANGLAVNIFITSDHGFSTTTGGFNVGGILQRAGLDEGARIVRNMVYLDEDDSERIRRIAEALQRDEHVGNVYTAPAHPHATEGIAPGTLSTAAIRWDHRRSSPILASPAWTDEANEHGYAGTTTFGGTATHGSDSPYDLRIPLIAAGPEVKGGLRSAVPTGNADLAPTVLHLHGITPPEAWDGRVLHELLQDGPDPRQVTVRRALLHQAVTYPDGFEYEAELETLRVDDTVYLRGAATRRAAPE